MKKKESIIPYFKDEVVEVGWWNLDSDSQVDTLAYLLYLEEVFELKKTNEWYKRESTLVMDQKYYSKKETKTAQHYYEVALNMIRNKKIQCLKIK